jgi:hypothetical protein
MTDSSTTFYRVNPGGTLTDLKGNVDIGQDMLPINRKAIVMEVSPHVFSVMHEKAEEDMLARIINPTEFDHFAAWAHETFGCVYHTEYEIVVVWEWNTLWKWRILDSAQ